jgi:hypothetical protein
MRGRRLSAVSAIATSKKPRSQIASAPREAAESYKHAWEVYNTARWPVENSPGKKHAYQKALESFQAYGKLVDPPIETVRIPFEGREIVGYLRLPPNVRPAPLLIGISGLDTRKEDVAATSDNFMRRGIGLLALDMPGTGQAPVKVEVGAERIYSRVLDYLQTRSDVDASASSCAAELERLLGGAARLQGARAHPRRGGAWRRHTRATSSPNGRRRASPRANTFSISFRRVPPCTASARWRTF